MLPNILIALFSSAFSLLWNTARESLVILQGKLPLHNFVVPSVGDFFHKTSQFDLRGRITKYFSGRLSERKENLHTYLSLMFSVVFSSKKIVYVHKLHTYITSFYITRKKNFFEEHTRFKSYQTLTYLLSHKANHN